jgi:hypothetical protein
MAKDKCMCGAWELAKHWEAVTDAGNKGTDYMRHSRGSCLTRTERTRMEHVAKIPEPTRHPIRSYPGRGQKWCVLCETENTTLEVVGFGSGAGDGGDGHFVHAECYKTWSFYRAEVDRLRAQLATHIALSTEMTRVADRIGINYAKRNSQLLGVQHVLDIPFPTGDKARMALREFCERYAHATRSGTEAEIDLVFREMLDWLQKEHSPTGG